MQLSFIDFPIEANGSLLTADYQVLDCVFSKWLVLRLK